MIYLEDYRKGTQTHSNELTKIGKFVACNNFPVTRSQIYSHLPQPKM